MTTYTGLKEMFEDIVKDKGLVVLQVGPNSFIIQEPPTADERDAAVTDLANFVESRREEIIHE